jgi:HD-like signal output (HDOD) protein/CheY-like chemotaxis protein
MARILIADDSAIIREPVAAALAQAGHTVLTARDGREALTLLRAQRVDLLVLDLSMPVLDGFGVLAELAKRPFARLAIVVMTESADRATIERAAKVGVRHYLSKSAFSLEALLDRVTAALAGKETGAAPQPSIAGPRVPTRSGVPAASPNEIAHLKPIVSRSDLEQRLAGYATLQAFPPAVGEVVKLCRQQGATADQIARAIRNDPAIAVKVLRLANSAAYATGAPIFSVEQAVVRVGVATIGQAVQNIGVVDHFASKPGEHGIDSRAFWEHSIGCGLIAARLASATRCMAPDAAFTMGLVHDIGRLMFVGALGPEYASVLVAAKAHGVALEQVERRMLLTTHAECMNKILAGWGFPREFVDPVSLHHCELDEIRAKAPKRWKESVVLALANRLTHALLPGTSENDTIYATREMCVALGVNAETLSAIREEVPDETSDLKLSMLATSSGSAGLRTTVVDPMFSTEGVRPLFVSACAELDACGFLLHTWGKPTSKPNVGVVLASDQEDLDAVSRSYVEHESRLGPSKLPLLVLAEKAALEPGETLRRGRHWKMASLPAPRSAVVTSLRALISGGIESESRAA